MAKAMSTDHVHAARLFGREEPLRQVRMAVDSIARQGRALVIVGDPGVGKTALLEAAAGDASRRGLTMLSVRGTEEEAHLRFAALHRLLAPVLDLTAGLPARHRAALLRAFGLADGELAPDPFFVALAALELIADAAAGSPVVLTVDDLHWVDGASRDAIGFLGRRIEAEPAVLLLAARPAAAGLLAGDPGLAVLRLDGLDPAASRALLREHHPRLSPLDERRVLDAAAGNPLALLELPLALSRSGRASPAGTGRPRNLHPAAGSMPLTARLERSFADRVHELDPADRTVLLVAALQDSDFLTETFAAAAELTGDSRASVAIDAAAAAGLLSVTGDSFRFRHPLVRSAIAQVAPPARRAEVHRAFARTLSADPDRATWHRSLAADGPDEELAAALDAGADRAAAHGAPDLAETWLERAAELSLDDRRRGRRLLRAAELAFELGRHESVSELMARARNLELDPPDYARLAGLEGAFDDGVPGDEANITRLVAAAGRARDGGEPELAAYLLLGAAMPCYWGAASEPLIARVRAAADGLGLPEADPRVMMLGALTAPFERGALITAQLAEWIRQATPDPALASALGRAGFVVGDFDSGLAFASRAGEGLRQRGLVALLTQALVLRTFSALYLGRWDVTQVASDEAYRFAVETRQPVWAACAQLGLANVAGLRGDYDRARTLAAEVERTALTAGNRALLSGVQLSRGFAALGADRPEEAFTEFSRMMDPDDQAYQSPQCAWAADYYAEAAALSGRSGRAVAVLEQLEDLTSATTAPGVRRAMALAGAFLSDEEDHLELARELAPGAPPWYRARLDCACGSWLLGRQRIAEARPMLRSAHAVFDAMGATAWAGRASRELTGSGQRAEPQARYAWARLSPQELQIAQLATEGLSNREIGARLYLSHRTVGSHLNRIYPKLGVHSRGELRAVLADPPPSSGSPQPGRELSP
jgi:DNA-binding CsgD family transcriptional regulator